MLIGNHIKGLSCLLLRKCRKGRCKSVNNLWPRHHHVAAITYPHCNLVQSWKYWCHQWYTSGKARGWTWLRYLVPVHAISTDWPSWNAHTTHRQLQTLWMCGTAEYSEPTPNDRRWPPQSTPHIRWTTVLWDICEYSEHEQIQTTRKHTNEEYRCTMRTQMNGGCTCLAGRHVA